MWCGIDPGKKGGIAFVDGSGSYEVYRFPLVANEFDYQEIYRLLNMHDVRGVALELVNAFPVGSRSSAFTFGRAFEVWKAFLNLSKLKHIEVRSTVWTKFMYGGKRKGLAAKEVAFIEARRLFPDWSPITKTDKELCDCLLLAEYARLKLN
jgi:hypothetical protein